MRNIYNLLENVRYTCFNLKKDIIRCIFNHRINFVWQKKADSQDD